MYSVSRFLSLAASFVGVWMLLLCGAGHSAPVKRDIHQCGGSGSESVPVHCVKQLDSKLVDDFLLANGGNALLYLQKFLIGNETAYAGSSTHIYKNRDCVEELVIDYDSQRFPQYVIQSICKSNCTSTGQPLGVLKLNNTECGSDGREKYEELSAPVILSLCEGSS